MQASEQNRRAWNAGAYESWINRFGTPEEAAKRIQQAPIKSIGTAFKYMEQPIAGKRIVNLLGSNGMKAVALAHMGAIVTVVDFSSGNERYAAELADRAGVALSYLVADVLKLSPHELSAPYDIVYMEMGILHYFTDLNPLFGLVHRLLNEGGMMILQDFHPVSTKLITSRGTTAAIRKHKVTGDYFAATLTETKVSHAKYSDSALNDEADRKVYLRHWTLGEIITAIAGAGLTIQVLEELPNMSSDVFDKGIPKTFTAVAIK
ncbi:class I SAM-dependent methyltransferase [Paenibacillus lycopersici]|uniref:Class I SAM-dependent methyltransferase n=2 Tax=Paenibacillus lycopersici TaxID=2704462 RepID=A0A6C0G8V6_9BACL|nr:class I SAM-dependent methyltransferase [Paenibacillus lycopersici]